QYLWSDRPKEAAQLFSEYLELHPRACETQLDLGLALSWANELDAARVAYGGVAGQCVYERGAARLGAARVLRWGNHFAESERRYRAIQADGRDLDREQGAIGLAYVRLAQGRPRAALALADSMIATGSNDRSLVEARAMALADLGALGAAGDLVHGGRGAGAGRGGGGARPPVVCPRHPGVPRSRRDVVSRRRARERRRAAGVR